jgi:2-methylcitrate dehydratase PrpD
MFKSISEDCFEPKHVSNPLMRDLVEKVHLVDAPLERGTPGEGPVTVRVKTDATVFEETVTYAPGHPNNPLGWDKLVAKYCACARQGGVEQPAIERSLESLSRVDEICDVRTLAKVLTLKA